MRLSAAEICAARGRAFSPVSNASTRNICMPPTPSIGMTEIAMTMMPRPPSHCNRPRQTRIPGGAVSRPMITVEPVVVIPDIASNTASVTLRSSSEKRNGRAAKSVSVSQLSAVITNAWRRLRRNRSLRQLSTKAKPTNIVMAEAVAKTCQSGLS